MGKENSTKNNFYKKEETTNFVVLEKGQQTLFCCCVEKKYRFSVIFILVWMNFPVGSFAKIDNVTPRVLIKTEKLKKFPVRKVKST